MSSCRCPGTTTTLADRPYGHYGRPVLVFPSEAGRRLGLREQRHDRRGRRPRRRRPGQVVLRRLARRVDAGPTAPCPIEERARAARALHGLAHRPGGAVDRRRRLAGGAGADHRRAAASAPTTRCTSPSSAPTWSPLAIGLSGNYDVVAPGTPGASAATRPTSPTPPTTCQPARRPPGLAARRSVSILLVVRPGALGDAPDRLAAVHPAAGATCCRRRASAASSTCGDTTSPTTGRGGAASSPTTCRVLLRHWLTDAPRPKEIDGRPTTDHLVGLLLGDEEDWPRAFEAIAAPARACSSTRRQPSTARHRAGHASSRSTCATRPATSSSSTGWRTGTTTRASG